jgi:hypothetical protein
MKHPVIILTGFFLLTSFLPGMKVRLMFIKNELEKASVIKTIRVYKYTDTTMLYGVINSSDTLSMKCWPGMSLGLTKKEKIKASEGLGQKFEGRWPDTGQVVLMVLDTNKLIKIFATRINTDYRFWDPYSGPFSNSIFFIPKEKPFKLLPVCLQIIKANNEYWTCEDGCLVDATAIKERN